jgi:hypothetical protein
MTASNRRFPSPWSIEELDAAAGNQFGADDGNANRLAFAQTRRILAASGTLEISSKCPGFSLKGRKAATNLLKL